MAHRLMTLTTLLALLLAGCGAPDVAPAGDARAAADLILATTTSTQDSGLLDVLIPRFEAESGYRVKPLAVGTGQALELGERGEADVLLVHAPEAEEEFMARGGGAGRLLVMYNDFVLAGPPADPAGIRGGTSISTGLERIASARAPFYSRGDDSGTHKQELALWRETSVGEPRGEWYRETGSGMGQTLRVASEKGGYTLTDRGTYLAQRETLDLAIVLEGDPALRNIYHVIRVNPERFPMVSADGARAFADFLVAPETQRLIGAFGREEYGRPLFVPCARNSCGLEEPGP